MKRLLILLFICFSVSSYAQTYRYRASSLAIGERTYSGNIAWGEWTPCNVIITINFDKDFIKVYSQRTQNYVIVSVGESYHDYKGGESVDMTAIDEEGIECSMCLRVQSDGVAQLYSYYSNIAWVYSDLEKL